MPDDNPYRLVARYRKARKIADALYKLEVPTDAFAASSDNTALRTLAAQVAGTNVPSETTWALVVELITEKRTSNDRRAREVLDLPR